jgi:predicted transcriptional regulator
MGSDGSSENGDVDEGDDDGNSKRKRVNISIVPKLHEASTEYAENRGKTYSQFITDLLVTEMESSPGESSTELQPVLQRQEALQADIRDVKEVIAEIANQQDQIINSLVDDDVEVIADEIEDILENADSPQSIPDIAEQLQYHGNRIENGLQHLEERYVVQRLEANTESELPKWELT